MYIHLTGKALAWQGGDEAGHFPAPGSLLLRRRLEQQGTREEAKSRKLCSNVQRFGEIMRKDAPPALQGQWPELFHTGITPTEEHRYKARGRGRSLMGIRRLTFYMYKKQSR